MLGGQASEGGFGVLNVGDGRVGEEEGGVVRADKNAGKGTFAMKGAGSGLEGQDGLHVLQLVSGRSLDWEERRRRGEVGQECKGRQAYSVYLSLCGLRSWREEILSHGLRSR